MFSSWENFIATANRSGFSWPDLLGQKFRGTLDLSHAVAGQIKFPATQNSSTDANILDDYEEGTWTPELTFGTPGNLSVAYTTQVGTYTKVGRMVYLSGTIQTSTFTHTTASGNLRINGLPFTALTLTGMECIGACFWSGITKATYTNVVATIGSGNNFINLGASGSGVSRAAVTASDCPSGGTMILGFSISHPASA